MSAVRAKQEQCAAHRILVVVKANQASSSAAAALELEGFDVVPCPAQESDARNEALLSDVRVAVLDELDGPDVVRWCQRARELPLGPFVLVLTGVQEVQVRAFQAGADDCLPSEADCSMIVQRVRVNALRNQVQRARSTNARALRTVSGELSLSLVPTISLAGIPLDLPRVQIRLLRKLMESSSPVSVADLSKSAWPNEFVAVHTVHTQIALLKARLKDLGVAIKHIRREGYVLNVAEQPERGESAS